MPIPDILNEGDIEGEMDDADRERYAKARWERKEEEVKKAWRDWKALETWLTLK